MENQLFGTKVITNVKLKALNSIKIGSRTFAKGEPVLYFDKIQMSTLSQTASPKTARGGKGNLVRVIWEDLGDMIFRITQGIVSQMGLTILSNARMLDNSMTGQSRLSKTERGVELDKNGKVVLKYTPIPDDNNFIFIYEKDSIQGEPIPFILDGKQIDCGTSYAYKTVLAEYYFHYGEESLIYIMDANRFNGLFRLEGTYESTDENEGLTRTNYIIMPRVKILSNLSLRLGEKADPTISNFTIYGMPGDTEHSNSSVLEIIGVDEDLEADI